MSQLPGSRSALTSRSGVTSAAKAGTEATKAAQASRAIRCDLWRTERMYSSRLFSTVSSSAKADDPVTTGVATKTRRLGVTGCSAFAEQDTTLARLVARMEPPGPAGACHRGRPEAGPGGPAR